jgi:uncharacterized protein YyaL (SSP411 family)
MENKLYTNALANETSPYLLQHAHNPVNWNPWNDEVLKRAKEEDKLLLISIGYSACHWCHVMEHECFEDEKTAEIMNKNFINIKVDREEHPDVDQVYMHAVQLLTGRGGWPLNCFALPDGRPIYGGTYFPKSQWQQVLLQIADLYRNDKSKCVGYAEDIKNEIIRTEKFVKGPSDFSFTSSILDEIYQNWKPHFDLIEGGPDHAPKFPLPAGFEFLLRYYYHTGKKDCLGYVLLTLDKMAYGGIYDHLGGGFARYSTDALWKVPHFEKMLYDNAQLVSLYSHAWLATKKDLYKNVVEETLDFIQREMTHSNGAFYSALDADSEGVEGKFYVWKKDDLEILPEKTGAVFKEYYNVNAIGCWEHENYILLRKYDDEEFAEKNNISTVDLRKIIKEGKKILFQAREKRIRPSLDDKILVSWNALMLKGYVDAFKAFGNESYLKVAITNAAFIMNECKNENGGLYHSYKNGIAKINGYLEDYCFTIEAFIALYEVTTDLKFLLFAKNLADYCMIHFFDKETGLFYFTSSSDTALITRKIEMEDQVIPSSNSSMAKALYFLGLYFPESAFSETAVNMISGLSERMKKYPSSYANWAFFLCNIVYPFYEIAIVGNDVKNKIAAFNKQYIPNSLLAGTKDDEHSLGIFNNRLFPDKTLIYVCEKQMCLLPEEDVAKSFLVIKAQ